LTETLVFVNLVFIMVNKKDRPSTKAALLAELREKQGAPVSGGALAKKLGLSRTAVWKGIQALCEAGYAIETLETGYLLDPQKEKDYLYPWEFGEQEGMFHYFESTGSTMDNAQELARENAAAGTVVIAGRQTSGRGRNNRPWASRQGGLFCTILERPGLSIADYALPSLALQIATARAVSFICGKKARLRWPNDVYIDQRKIAGIITEMAGEADMVSWLAGGVGVNVNNPAPSGKTTSCAEITGHPVSRREVLRQILYEIEFVKKRFCTPAAYSQGNRALAAEWNSLSDCTGANAAVVISEKRAQVLARGVFAGIDPAGRCIIKTGKGTLYFNPGPISLVLE
jgi:BirA family biotin operon repressor/biotin-[acetyl-CoA-carboxylase] ligase